ncbi:hypothetical protein NUW54_g8282 [Trametes sanguinea]|uniref:Uncharacterized protein n=1 Tax=Trametes sanguinea TaxID=158606 RepID=A0ACC1PGB7_9APHY|nr:hypothetical protein NUW54_g8282 [Trametes sanguinea]
MFHNHGTNWPAVPTSSSEIGTQSALERLPTRLTHPGDTSDSVVEAVIMFVVDSGGTPFLPSIDDLTMSHTAQAAPAGGSPPGGGPSKRAPRGAACLNCRRRKMRCDGARPICGQCIRTNREIDCEYTDGPGPSPTQILEEQIARLESRIRELEHPELVPPSVTLNPATAAALRTQSPSGSIGSAGRSLLGRVVTPDALPAAMPSAAVPVLSQDPLVEPPADLVRNLVNAFLQHSASLSFFLHVPRFMQAMQQPNIDNRRVQLSPALLNAVYLWGAHLSTSAALRAYESIFQVRATNALSSALRESQYSVINLIQAECSGRVSAQLSTAQDTEFHGSRLWAR